MLLEATAMDQERAPLDEFYDRLHKTGPEFRGFLSNHGPMVVEAMVRHGHDDAVLQWLDGYVQRLEPFPSSSEPIGSDWRQALGDVRRVGDWTRYFEKSLAEQPWPTTLNVWWPRLLPGIAAGATHGVIRVGHAVRTLTTDGESPLRIRELAHGLAYWASRWQSVSIPSNFWESRSQEESRPSHHNSWAIALGLDHLPRLEPLERDEGGGLDGWISRMAEISGWPDLVYGTQIPENPEDILLWLAHVVDAAVIHYRDYGHGNGIMMVHSVTAPNAVWRALPALDRHWWRASAFAAWIATASLTTIYASRFPMERTRLREISPTIPTPEDTFARAVAHGDEHVIKFADTALDVYARTQDSRALAAVYQVGSLIKP